MLHNLIFIFFILLISQDFISKNDPQKKKKISISKSKEKEFI